MPLNDPGLPRISIVVPSYNQGRFLAQALDSIFRQDYPQLDVIVMDGGSTDESVEVIRSYAPRLNYWQSEADGGQSAAINAGMIHAHGDLVAWLNSDDYYLGDCLWTVADAYRQFPGRGLYVGNGLRRDQGTGRTEPFCNCHMALNRAALMHGLDYILQPATFFLRTAWETAGGLDAGLQFGMDWDLIIRIAQVYPAVLINEFLAVSREYAETKTRAGGLERVIELRSLARRHTGREFTTGSLAYLLSALLEMKAGSEVKGLSTALGLAVGRIKEQWHAELGNTEGFPVRGDPQDATYLPLVTEAHSRRTPRRREGDPLPTISIVCTASDPALQERTVQSIMHQEYANVEVLLAAPDASWTGEGRKLVRTWPPRNPAATAEVINAGLSQAGGDVLGWLRAGDRLSAGALHEIGAAFAWDRTLDLVYGNALFLDEAERLHVIEGQTCATAFCFGQLDMSARMAPYSSDIHLLPHPPLFFRRRLWEGVGKLEKSYRHLFDLEFCWRLGTQTRIRKIEKTLAVYQRSAARWSEEERERQAEWYCLNRSRWPGILRPGWRRTLSSYVKGYVRQRYGPGVRSAAAWTTAALVAASALLRIGNPETWRTGTRGLEDLAARRRA